MVVTFADYKMKESENSIILWLVFLNLIKESNTDALTNVLNKRGFDEVYMLQKKISLRYKRNLSLILMDIKDLKSVNDLQGHKMGNKLLCLFTKTVSNEIRSADILCRIGGDEFALILPETDYNQAKILLQRIINEINKFDINISYGLTDNNIDQDLFEMADQKLIQNKNVRM